MQVINGLSNIEGIANDVDGVYFITEHLQNKATSLASEKFLNIKSQNKNGLING